MSVGTTTIATKLGQPTRADDIHGPDHIQISSCLTASVTADHLMPYMPAPTPRSADLVLYLDLDGVVNHEAVLWHPRRGIHMSSYERQAVRWLSGFLFWKKNWLRIPRHHWC